MLTLEYLPGGLAFTPLACLDVSSQQQCRWRVQLCLASAVAQWHNNGIADWAELGFCVSWPSDTTRVARSKAYG